MIWPPCDRAGDPRLVKYPTAHIEMRVCSVLHRLVALSECEKCRRQKAEGGDGER